MAELSLKQDMTEDILKWINRKQALLAHTESVTIKIKVYVKIGKNTNCMLLYFT